MLTLLCLALGAAPDARPLTFEDLLVRRRPAPAEVQAQAALAEAERLVTTSGGLLRDGPTLAVTAGPRRDAEGDARGDLALGADLPLVLSRGTSETMSRAFERAAPLMRAAARAEAELALRRATLDAWLDERLVTLRDLDVQTVVRWLGIARARREAGADAPFQATLVEGELLRARNELAEARAHRLESWGRVRALADVGEVPLPLADPPGEAVDAGDSFESGLMRQAALARRDLDLALAERRRALARARLSLRADLRKEGAEEIAALGVAVRLPRQGESSAIGREAESSRAAAMQQAEAARAELEARLASARERLAAARHEEPAPDFEAALRAVDLRLTEGKERASEALPIRRQLLEARVAGLRRRHALALAAAELAALTAEGTR